jgi:DNA-binding ferritin-like protein
MSEKLGKPVHPKVAPAIACVSDLCAAAAGDIHTLHLNMNGKEFDTMHKKVLLKYYEELDSDYDELAEFAACFDWECKNKNESAKRIDWESYDNGTCDRQEAVLQTALVLGKVLDGMHELYVALNKLEDDAMAVGVANWLQGRLEYWGKELNYFNQRRVE